MAVIGSSLLPDSSGTRCAGPVELTPEDALGEDP
jgi:hypothetical protein